jgi:hypothetical protein
MLMRSMVPWLAWFVAWFWLWMWLVGDWNRIEWIAGAIVAAVAATISELLRRAAGTQLLLAPDVLRASALVIPMVFVDFGLLVYALVTRRRGDYVTRAFAPGPKTTPAGAARRAWTVLLAGYSPNSYVVDIDADEETALLHVLVPCRKSEEPA